MELALISTLLVSAIPFSLIGIFAIDKLLLAFKCYNEKTKTILTNITGTLTESHLELSHFYFDDYQVTPQDNTLIAIEKTNRKKQEIRREDLTKFPEMQLITKVLTLCRYDGIVKIESALISFIKKCTFKPDAMRRNHEIIQKLPSNRLKKVSAIIARHRDEKELYAYAKGHPDKLLAKCSRILLDGRKQILTHEIREKLEKRLRKLGEEGAKVIAFAYKGLPLKRLANYEAKFIENDLIFIGLAALEHPLKAKVKESALIAKELGLRIIPITSHKKRKAVAVCNRLKVIDPHNFQVVSSENIHEFQTERLAEILKSKKDLIFAELEGKDKERMINRIQKVEPSACIITEEKPANINEIIDGIKKTREGRLHRPRAIIHALSCKLGQFLFLLALILTGKPLALSLAAILFLDIFINIPLEFTIKQQHYQTRPLKSIWKPALGLGLILASILSAVFYWNLTRHGWMLHESPNDSHFLSNANSINTMLIGAIMIIYSLILIRKKSLISSLTMVLAAIILLFVISIDGTRSLLGIKALDRLEWQVIGFISISILIIWKLVPKGIFASK